MTERSERLVLPVLPLREVVLFPGTTAPIGAGRPGTLRAIEAALNTPDRLIFAVSQRQNVEQVTPEGLFTIGTIARIGQMQRGLAGMQLLLHGERRGIAMHVGEKNGFLESIVREAEEMAPLDPEDAAFVALHREARTRAGELGQKSGLPEEVVQQVLAGVHDPGKFADLVAGYLDIAPPDRQALLETLSVEERLRRVLVHMQRQISVLDAQEDIKSQVQEELGERQREMFLREQLKQIRRELGEDDERGDQEELRETLELLELPPEARKEVDRELARLERISKESMEAQVVRTFLETVAELPWNERSEESLDLVRAQAILDEDHYALGDVKDRVLEFLAVRQLKAETARRPGDPASDEAAAPELTASAGGAPAGLPSRPAVEPPKGNPDEKATKGPILLFVGPPGVGKTSVAKSIARAMGRKYVRISLGGARDEADIRGHRRTYVGAMPGRIIQGMKQAGTRNPVFLLDEVDKLGVSFQGDPASALLEVLDPAQNDSFVDHYLGVPFDLSEVLFICTANFLQNIPAPLLDRMETVDFAGYTEREKLMIARNYLVPRQLTEHGLDVAQIALPDEAVAEVIASYTREAGVRQLEREIGKLCRKVARKIATREVERLTITRDMVDDLLGRPKVHPERAAREDQIGVATGMYYTPVGGDIMFVEASVMKGKGELLLTGQLGDVMKESARAALTYARSHAAGLHIREDVFGEHDVHVHVPAGAIPKDGPSAGVTMATALVSVLSGRPVRNDIAMTGEITLRGEVLPIGGVKEKVLGAVRAGIGRIILPKKNEPDLEDLPEEVRTTIEIYPVENLGQVLALALRGATFREGRLLFGDQVPGDVAPLQAFHH
ncbi:MAG: endopeptidase La [Gemmatimonadetes bacterium]|nr:endopeptidase La [Gemmatimonadota bacterium]MBK7925848.1 endopeptidase La [Gemmatimonadota bacterium]MBK9066566.1 endopeptidase La [Gemmatimonadota bacterium]MBK9691863.1 endopeptidase La [Gemmatimonadota bacterium]